MNSPSEILKLARERTGKSQEELARSVDREKAWYYDLESDDDEIETNVAIEKLQKICSELGISVYDLFCDSAKTFEPVSPQTLTEKIKKHLEQNQLTIEEFEDRVGWGIGSNLDNPLKVSDWDIDCLRSICGEIGINWLHVL